VADKIFVVCGIDALYKQVHDVVFRWELLRDEVGIGGNTVITPDIFMRFFSGSILFKGVDLQKCCVVLNKYDSLTQKRYGSYIASWLCSNVEGLEVIISSVNHRAFYKISH
jgi:hypothetical protein